MKKGKLLIFSAPSGSGKTTLLNHVMANIPEMAFSVSATTRPPRGEEVNGREYYFLTMEDFKQRVENGEFLEWEEVYPGRCYGTLLSVVEQMQLDGKHVARWSLPKASSTAPSLTTTSTLPSARFLKWSKLFLKPNKLRSLSLSKGRLIKAS